MVGAFGFAQGDGYTPDVGIGVHGKPGNRLILLDVQLAFLHGMGAFRLEQQGLLEVLLVGDHGINVLDQLGHDLVGRLAVLPEILTVVKVAAYMQAHGLGAPDGLQAQIRRTLADGGRNTGQMEPRSAVKSLLPVNIPGLGFTDGTACAVIDHLAGALHRAGFQKVNAHAAVPPDNIAHIHAKAAQFPHTGIAYIVFWQHAHKGGIHAIVRQGNAYVRLSAAKGGLQAGGLEQTLVAGAFQAEHDLAKGNNLRHGPFILSLLGLMRVISAAGARRSRQCHP